METKTGLIGLAILLSIFGGVIYLDSDQIDNAFYCTASEEVGLFYGGVSGTGYTAYPYTENRSNYVRCNKEGIKGTWIPLLDYMDEQNDIEEPEINLTKKRITIEYPDGRTYECYFQNEFNNNSIKSISECVLR